MDIASSQTVQNGVPKSFPGRRMDPLPRDVSSEIVELIVNRCRQMTPNERILKMLLQLNAFVKATQTTAVRAAYPDADEFEVNMRVASRWVEEQFKRRTLHKLGAEDAIGVLAVQRDRLDEGYFNFWAIQLGLSELLTRARQMSH